MSNGNVLESAKHANDSQKEAEVDKENDCVSIRKIGFRKLNVSQQLKLENEYSALRRSVKDLSEASLSLDSIVTNSKILNKNLQTCNRLAKEAYETVSQKGIALDSDYFAKSGHLSLKFAKAADADYNKFNTLTFASLLTTFFKSCFDCDPVNASRSPQDLYSNPFLQLGQKYSHLVADIPCFNYIYGAFDSQDFVKNQKERKQKGTQLKNDAVSKQAQVVDLKDLGKNGDNLTAKNVDLMFQSLRRKYKENNKKPVTFFDFVTSDSFPKTVENIFHTAFLVKEGVVNVNRTADTEDVVIEPCKKKDDIVENNQTILSFSMDDWKEWINANKA